ncbi:MAG: CbrC family protein [Corynebacterium humireducens]|jgi:uncharacterized protein CbrC (UPF0167 family)|uniref:CbrC family protein n=1 Tax=Corynebacterium humireducens TaxID=1223514 RepID=A0A7X6PLC3_9CORY|nr:CbrC family protein [Corynebacterium humireducens]
MSPERALPSFRLHPDPVATGAIEPDADAVCECCGEQTGWNYTAPVYGPHSGPEFLCPWCIASGRAARELEVSFAAYTVTNEPIPPESLDEISHRTPCFMSWQDPMWMTHCGDAAAFLGEVGWDTLQSLPDAQESLIDFGLPAEELPHLVVDGSTAAFLFRCLTCGTHVAYYDMS